ncbi:MAG: isochorismate synthase, partial [Maribacter sp.]
MLQDLIDRATEAWQDRAPFVLYSKPNDLLVNGIFQKNSQLHLVKDFTETGFLFAPFDLESDIVLIPTDEILFAEFQTNDADKGKAQFPLTSDAEREKYLRMIQKAISELNSGNLKKVVLSRKVNVEQHVVPLELYL